jgi:hypothetical protein
MPIVPKGWIQINFRAPASWKGAAEALKKRLATHGELISLEEAVRRLYRRGAETEGVWTEEPT